MVTSISRGAKMAAGIKLPRGNSISITKGNMIIALDGAGYGPAAISRALSVSRTTIYYRLHPDKYKDKLEYVRKYRHAWTPEKDPWELENG